MNYYILAQPRSGSTWITKLIHLYQYFKNKQSVNLNELFNKNETSSAIQFLDNIRAPYTIKFLTRMLFDQNIQNWLLQNPSTMFVLDRKDRFERTISLFIAKQHDIWTLNKSKFDYHKIKITDNELVELMKAQTVGHNQTIKFLTKYPAELVTKITYEDIISPLYFYQTYFPDFENVIPKDIWDGNDFTTNILDQYELRRNDYGSDKRDLIEDINEFEKQFNQLKLIYRKG